MSPDLLFQHFHRIADAPDAIPRLRRFILDLAVRGKLVEQDPRDELASELVKHIQMKKERLVKAGEVKKLETFETVRVGELSFTIPFGWEVVRMGWLARKLGAGSTPLGGKSVYQSVGVPFLRSQNVHNHGLRLDDVALIPRTIHDRMSGTHVQQQDILLNITGASIGRCALVPSNFVEGNVSQHVAIIRLFLPTIREFIHLSMTSPFFQKVIDEVQVGVSREGLSMQRLRLFPTLLPPLAEQHRIVVKVDELMALCDRLEAAQTERESHRDRLVASSLNRLNNGVDPDAFREHARFYFNHLSHLTTRSEHIKQLRQTILNLAVRGKLVPQDPTDEPASELLKNIELARRRLLAERKIPKPKDLPVLENIKLPFSAPPGWEWTFLGKLCYQVSDGPHHSPQYVSPDSGVPFLSTRNVRVDRFDLSGLKYVSKEDHERFCQRIRPEQGDILYTKGGTTGIARVNDLDFEFSVWVHLAVLRVAKQFLAPQYVALALNSLLCYDQSQAYTQGISNFDLGLTRMIKIVIPLPPLAEQHRIVAKVDELMVLCDQLETKLTTTQTKTRHLLDSLLNKTLAKQTGKD